MALTVGVGFTVMVELELLPTQVTPALVKEGITRPSGANSNRRNAICPIVGGTRSREGYLRRIRTVAQGLAGRNIRSRNRVYGYGEIGGRTGTGNAIIEVLWRHVDRSDDRGGIASVGGSKRSNVSGA